MLIKKLPREFPGPGPSAIFFLAMSFELPSFEAWAMSLEPLIGNLIAGNASRKFIGYHLLCENYLGCRGCLGRRTKAIEELMSDPRFSNMKCLASKIL